MVFKEMYYVRHRRTGEIAFVELGARYDQHMWELLSAVPKPEPKE